MVKSVAPTKQMQASEQSKDIKQANSAMSMGMNVIVMMVTMFAAGWYVCKNTFGGDVAGVIGGLIGAIIAMLVEMWLFVIRGSRIDAQDEKKRIRQAAIQKKRPVLASYGSTTKSPTVTSSPNYAF